MWKRILLLLPLIALLTGCATTSTNLSATRQVRNENNLYPVGVKFDSRQQTLRWDSIEAFVIVGKESYPMRRTHLMRNRWEGLIPVPATAKSVDYHYKFEFAVNEFGGQGKGSASSRTYTLQILD
jgi:uncharacterized lipoprotein YmbA